MTPTETAELMQAVADVVRDQVELGLRDLATELAVAKAHIAALQVVEKAHGELRERLVVMETKAGVPIDIPTVDLSPVLERVAVAESQIDRLSGLEKSVGELRDRLVVCEQRGLDVPPSPEPVDLAPVLECVAELQKSLEVTSVVQAAPSVDLSPVWDRIARTETELVKIAPTVATVSELVKDVSGLRERVAVVETRATMAGPAGPKGDDGRDGQNGKDGADGVGWDDLTAVQNDDRSVTVKAMRGERVKDIGTVVFPVEIYRGVYVDGRQYERGDCVTWGGSEFHCNEQTTTKPEQSKAWTLKVKRGRDGRDGKDAPTVPIVSVVRPS
jgi:hypothetical protein